MFKFEDNWDVDKAAESLNTSLFGSSKGHSTLLHEHYGSKASANAIPDSDDEQYSKKDKKRLKKRRNKKNLDGKTSENDSIGLLQDYHVKDAVKNRNTITGDKSVTEQKLKVKISLVKSNSNKNNVKNKKFKQSKSEENNTIASVNKIEQKNRKRKRSESVDNIAAKKNRMDKHEGAKSSPASSTNDVISIEAKKKRKRNRKKKNNSKKNKYKHLALNSKNKTGNLGISQDSTPVDTSIKMELISSNTSQMSSGSSLNILSSSVDNNKGMSSIKNITHISAIKKNAIKGDNSDSVFVQSLSENTSKKRQKSQTNISHSKISQNGQPPAKKSNKNKANSRNSTLASSSQSQLVIEASDLQNLSSVISKTSTKNKQKQVLLKMLNGITPKNKPNTTVVNGKMGFTLDKKSKKGVSSVPNGPTINNFNLSSKILTPETKHNNKTDKEDKIENDTVNISVNSASTSSPVSQSIWGKAAVLGQQAKEKLNSARFRFINEQLYSCSGNDALKLFREDQDSFSVYHKGFENQTSKWPVNPLDVFIKQFKDKPKNLILADFGCGDAKLAQNVPQKVYSFDLVALNDRVTACDMSKTPLPSEKVDIAVFCLSLMGTNIGDYIQEANRVLKTGGLLKVAEVVSRFSALSRFTDGVCSYGFQLLNKRDLNQMFYLMDFKKVKSVKKSASLPEIKLKPCIYKRR